MRPGAYRCGSDGRIRSNSQILCNEAIAEAPQFSSVFSRISALSARKAFSPVILHAPANMFHRLKLSEEFRWTRVACLVGSGDEDEQWHSAAQTISAKCEFVPAPLGS